MCADIWGPQSTSISWNSCCMLYTANCPTIRILFSVSALHQTATGLWVARRTEVFNSGIRLLEMHRWCFKATRIQVSVFNILYLWSLRRCFFFNSWCQWSRSPQALRTTCSLLAVAICVQESGGQYMHPSTPSLRLHSLLTKTSSSLQILYIYWTVMRLIIGNFWRKMWLVCFYCGKQGWIWLVSLRLIYYRPPLLNEQVYAVIWLQVAHSRIMFFCRLFSVVCMALLVHTGLCLI